MNVINDDMEAFPSLIARGAGFYKVIRNAVGASTAGDPMPEKCGGFIYSKQHMIPTTTAKLIGTLLVENPLMPKMTGVVALWIIYLRLPVRTK